MILFAAPNEIGVGSLQSERTWIVAEDSSDQTRNGHDWLKMRQRRHCTETGKFSLV